jgi:hypothetical protein
MNFYHVQKNDFNNDNDNLLNGDGCSLLLPFHLFFAAYNYTVPNVGQDTK